MISFKRAKTAADFEPSTDVFPSISSQDIAKDACLKKRGRDDGAKDYPSADATALSAAEQEAINELSRRRKRGIDQFNLHYDAYQGRIELVQGALAKLDKLVGELLIDMQATGRVQNVTAMGAQRALADHHAGLKAYCDKHKLVGAPKPAQSLWTVAFLIFLFFSVEIILGALFFQEHSPGGLVGSATYAVMISLVNVAISGTLGHFSRYGALRGFWNKVLGIACWLLFLAFALAFNLFVGHYRRATDEMPWEEAASAMFDSFTIAPFDLGSFNAFLIAAFGVVVSIFAFLKIRGWEDIHPGYNRLYNAREDADAEYAEAYEETQEKLRDLFEESSDAIMAEAHHLRAALRGSVHAHAGQTTLVTNLQGFLDECDQCAKTLVTTYREENEKARKAPRPKYFSDTFTFDAAPYREAAAFDESKIEPEVKRIEEEARKGVAKILRAREEQLEALPEPCELLGERHPEKAGTASREAHLKVVNGGAD